MLISCIECKNEVSEYADHCLKCGCPVSVIKRLQQERIKADDEKYKVIVNDTEHNLFGIYSLVNAARIDEAFDALRKMTGADEEIVFQLYDYILNDLDNEERLAEENTEDQAIDVVCPYCKSSNVRKIGAGGRLVSVGMLGLAGSKVGKQWHCNNCNSDF